MSTSIKVGPCASALWWYPGPQSAEILYSRTDGAIADYDPVSAGAAPAREELRRRGRAREDLGVAAVVALCIVVLVYALRRDFLADVKLNVRDSGQDWGARTQKWPTYDEFLPARAYCRGIA